MKTRILIFTFFTFFLFSAVQGQVQNRNFKTTKISGIAVDAEGFPIKNGSVFVDSLKTGVRTNKKGQYKLRIPINTNFISIFSSEYGIQSEVFNFQKEINFTFPENAEVISQEDLVKMGYVFDVEEFQNLGKKSYSEYTSIYQIIREKFSGVRIDGNGNIYVRGVISLDGNQTPLFIVDGNYVNSISGINPDELKSIELLKGEDTALYGARGAGGVFLITLK